MGFNVSSSKLIAVAGRLESFKAVRPKGWEAIRHASFIAFKTPSFPALIFTLVSRIYIYYYDVSGTRCS
jgi:hypothetical protein